MNTQAKLEISTLAAALALGVLGDLLLRCSSWGLNFAIWLLLLSAAMAWLGRDRLQTFAEGGWWLLLPLALSALAFLWRDSLALSALNVLAIFTALSLVMLRAQGVRLRTSSMMQYLMGGLVAGVSTAFGVFPLLFGKSEWKGAMSGGAGRSAAVLRGVAFSLLPLLVFGSLLMAADAVFQNLIQRVWHFDFTHLLLAAFIATCVGGYLSGMLFAKGLTQGAERSLPPASLGAIEMTLMLGLLDVLFVVFVAVQVRFFFGGSALVQATTGLTYAEYARRGFFQLLAVAALVLPFLLLVHWLLRPDDAPAQSLFRWLAGIEIGLLFVIMISAFERMRLYEAEYGLSEQRLYPTAFMGWLAVVFVWFCVTVLRGHRERFAFGAMMAGFLLIAALHLINPDALIARTNLARGKAGLKFDAFYAAGLSADAVPELVAGLPDLNSRDRCTMASELLKRWRPLENQDWRAWNLARSRAWQAVSTSQPVLRAACAEHQAIKIERPAANTAGR